MPNGSISLTQYPAAMVRLTCSKCGGIGYSAHKTFILLILLASSSCAVGPEIVAGGESAVSIKAGPLANADRLADRHCRRYDKYAEFIGSQPLGPKSTRRLYAYDCVGVRSAAGQRSTEKRR